MYAVVKEHLDHLSAVHRRVPCSAKTVYPAGALWRSPEQPLPTPSKALYTHAPTPCVLGSATNTNLPRWADPCQRGGQIGAAQGKPWRPPSTQANTGVRGQPWHPSWRLTVSFSVSVHGCTLFFPLCFCFPIPMLGKYFDLQRQKWLIFVLSVVFVQNCPWRTFK